MSFFSRGSNGRGRGRNNFWQRGNRRPRFSIHFDVDPQELNQLFQAGFFNLVGQGVFQPHLDLRDPLSNLIRISQVSMFHLMSHSSQRSLVNDGWKDIVNQPAVHHHGWPTVSLPLPPPPPHNQHAQQIDHIASPAQSSHASKKLKTTIPEPLSSKGKKVLIHAKSSSDSSQSVTSHAQQNNEQSPLSVKFSLMCPINQAMRRSTLQTEQKRQQTVGRNKLLLIVNMAFDYY
jgi:hypothetical protein